MLYLFLPETKFYSYRFIVTRFVQLQCKSNCEYLIFCAVSKTKFDSQSFNNVETMQKLYIQLWTQNNIFLLIRCCFSLFVSVNRSALITHVFQYIELARTLRHYDRVPAGEAVTESSNISGGGSDSTCRVRVSLASKELTLTSIDQPHREQRYKVTRMRCWRITTLHTVSIIKFYIAALKSLYVPVNVQWESTAF